MSIYPTIARNIDKHHWATCVSHLIPENAQLFSVLETLQNLQETAGQAAEQTGEPVQFTTPSLLP